MRNILIFPDGSRQDFMYPSNRDLKEGEDLQVQMKDDSIILFKICSIEVKEKEVHFTLCHC